jgi:XRE family transcriptional regulator, regulator of sulfur utilization
MVTKRDSLVALLTVCATLAVVTLGQTEKPLMGSSVFDWTAIEATPTKVGSTRKFFQAPTATLDELECHVTTLNPGETPHPPHKHLDEEVIIVKEGVVEALVNGQEKRVGPGSVIFQASNQLHSIRNVGQTAAVYHVIKWNSPGMLKNRTKQ